MVSDKALQNEDAQKALEILENADLGPQDDRNRISLEHHGGPHGDFYHKAVRNRLEAAKANKTPHTEEYRQAVRDALHKLKEDIARPGSPLNRAATRTSPGGVR